MGSVTFMGPPQRGRQQRAGSTSAVDTKTGRRPGVKEIVLTG